MRSLATIRIVTGKSVIDWADNIELVHIDGWQVIVRKAENYQIGDKTIYVEIDSLLPETEWSEFLRPKKFKIKTMKLKGVLSQGICFPLSILDRTMYKGKYEVGEDVTEILGITQFDKIDDKEDIPKKKMNPLHKYLLRYRIYRKFFGKNSKQRRGWPEWITKTDEIRIENFPFYLQEKNIRYTVTTKLDGSSYTFGIKKDKTWYNTTKYEYYLCSRNVRKGIMTKELAKARNDQWSIPVHKYDLKNALKCMLYRVNLHRHEFDAMYIQGEIIGPGIQKNHYQRNDFEVYVFNVVLVNTKTGEKYKCNYDEQEEFCETYNIPQVELREKYFVLPDTIPELQKWVHRKSILNPKFLDEGCVFRNYEKDRSFKCVDPDFLLKYNNFDGNN